VPDVISATCISNGLSEVASSDLTKLMAASTRLEIIYNMSLLLKGPT